MNKIYGVFVDDKLVLVTEHKIKHSRQAPTWDKVRNAVCDEFSCYDSPNCNMLYTHGELIHRGKRIYTEELPM